MQYVPRQLLVRLRQGVDGNAQRQLLASTGTTLVRDFPNDPTLKLLALPDGMAVPRARQVFAARPEVEIAEPDYIYHIARVPDDPSFAEQWGLLNTGQLGGTAGIDIGATTAWNRTTGSDSVYIGVIDTGIYYEHPDLAPNVWTNPGEIAGNDTDDDNNGWADDVHGINANGDAYLRHDGDARDNNGHGTAVAGVIAARGNDGVGVTGVMWRARLIGCKALNENGGGRLSSFIECLEYFSKLKSSGIDIVVTNNSWGGGPYSQLLYNAIDRHRQQGMLFVAAAGNDGRDLDTEPDYPAAYSLDNIVSVAALDPTGSLAEFSNHGATTVDIAAPGVAIYSTWLDNYGTLDGTSLAAPYVTGVVGLLKAKDPTLTSSAIKSRILATGIVAAGLQGRVLSGRRLFADIPVVDRDADGMDDDWEVSFSLNPTSAADAAGDPDADGLTNVREYQADSDPRRRDTDSDGLTDGAEVLTHQTNPNAADTDGDTLTDFAEVTTHGTSPKLADTDADGLTDSQEVQTPGTNPLRADTDNDGISDGWERQYGLNPSVADASADRDGDGLTNAQEFALDSNPNAADTDDDGLTDFVENRTHGTSPTRADTDGDAAGDGWELANGFNPLAAADGVLDTDNDGWSNHAEFRVGTNPRSSISTPPIRPWSEVQGGPTHTGHVLFETDAQDFTVRWVRGLDGGTTSMATAMAGESIVIGYTTNDTNEASVATRRLLDGTEQWRHGFANPLPVVAATVAGGISYSLNGLESPPRIQAVDVTTGAGRFERVVNRYWVSSFVTHHAGRLYTFDVDDSGVAGVTSYDAPTGAERWRTPVGSGYMSWRSIAVDDSYAVVVPASTLAVLDRSTGSLRFEITEPSCLSDGADTILDGRGNAYAYAHGCVVKFDLAARRIKWQRDGLSTVVDSVAVDDDQVYVGDSTLLVALRADTGIDAWRFQGPDVLVGNRVGNLAVTLDHVFFSTDDGTFALDRATGAKEWSHGLTGELAISEDGALVITSDSMMGAIDLLGDRDGDTLPDWWERRYGFNLVSAADAVGDPDADGVANTGEFAARTEPRIADTDADGLNDGAEAQGATDSHGGDTDHDGLGDRDEVVVHSTLPTEVDSDDDGYTDFEERMTYLTNARDASSVPTGLLRSHRESFENGLAPGWALAEPGSPPGWSLANSAATDGAFSLSGRRPGPDIPIAEWRRNFEAGDVSFAWRMEAGGRLRVYVDAAEAFVVDAVNGLGWARQAIHLPRGDHRIRFAAEGSGAVWIDDVRFDVPAPFAADPRNTFATTTNSLRELTRDGAWARAPLRIPGAKFVTDAFILPDHRIALADPPRLQIFDPVSSYAYATSVEGWSGGTALVATGTNIVAVNGNVEGGLLRFDLEGRYLGRLHVGRRYSDLTKAENDTLYALQRENGVIDTIDPQTLAITATTKLELATGFHFAVAPNGEFYVADVWCIPCINVIVRYGSDGRFIEYRDVGHELKTSVGFIPDVDYLPPGRLAMGTRFGQVVFTTLDFAEFSIVSSGNEEVPIADGWVARVEKRGIDSDGDTLPDWWERLHRLNVTSAADRLLDADGDGLTNLQEFARDTSPRSADTDTDGLTDGAEVNARGTDPLTVDSDRDGLGDGEEVNTRGTSPTVVDTDGDGLKDGNEVTIHHTDPLRADTDGDGSSDAWELGNGLNPLLASDAAADNDLDGVSNVAELTYGTNPNDADSDYDGADDGYEISVARTDPLRDDSDGDRVIDGWEIDEGFDPRAAADATLDADGDGFDNRTEYYADSNPRNASSVPFVDAWYTHQGNAAHTGYVPVHLVPSSFTPYWLRKPVARSTLNLLQPAAVDGRVFVTSSADYQDSTVAELDGLTGAEAWRFALGPATAQSPPAVAAGTMFTFSSGYPGRLLGFDATGGARVDRREDSGAFNNLAPTPFGDHVYMPFMLTYGFLGAYDARTGVRQWYVETSASHGWTPAVDRNFIYFWSPNFALTPAYLGVLYRDTGSRRATIIDPSFEFAFRDLNSSPVLGGRDNVLAVVGGRLVSFDVRRSRVAWEKQSDYAGTPAVANGVIYVLDGGVLVALEESDGRELWRWLPPTIIDSDIVATVDHVLVATRTTTYAIRVADGQQVWSYPRGGALALGNDRVLYMAGTDGAVQAVATFADADRDGVADTWEQLNGFSTANPADAALDPDGDQLVNRAEFHAQTNPRAADTDGDGLSDSAERGGFDALRKDSDSDGLDDVAEINRYGSDPHRVDSDSDGLSDSIEALTHQTDPVRSDTDGDAVPDALEVRRGSNPLSASSKPQPVMELVESFESGLPAHWRNGVDAAAGWEIVAGGVDGSHELRSAPLDPQEIAAIEWTDYFGGGRVIFHASVTDSPMEDRLELLIDGQLATGVFTASPYKVVEAALLPGVHTLRWQFKYGTIGTEVYHPVGHIDLVQVTSQQPDADGDGMGDHWENTYGFNPFRASDGAEDFDGDGLSNRGEYAARTDPKVGDTDRDGLPDGWEVRYGFDPTVSGDAPNDPDGDGSTNAQEYAAGTDPKNAASRPGASSPPPVTPPTSPPPSSGGGGGSGGSGGGGGGSGGGGGGATDPLAVLLLLACLLLSARTRVRR